MRIAFATFGCKINQYETENLRDAAAEEGNAIVPFDGDADVYVINTCSVTGKSDYQCRQAVRAAVRRGKGAQVIVTGCYAETRPDDIRAIPGVTHVVGNRDKGDVLRLVAGPVVPREKAVPVGAMGASSRTRKFLKIQDGCDSRCAYCIVPRARGSSRSVPREEVLRSFLGAASSGAPEVVLSGIHIGRYGMDLTPRSSLTELVQELVLQRGNARIRISSIEPREVTPGITDLLGNGICRHLHIPLQSGDDSILSSMGREYTVRDYRKVIDSVASAVPDVALGADVMVGFPGECDSHYENTKKLIEELPLTHLHVFSFSPRPGTPAASMDHQVAESVKRSRNEELRSIGLKKNLEFKKRFLGKRLEVVMEDRVADKEQRLSGLSDNYIKIVVERTEEKRKNKVESIVVQKVDRDGVLGTIYSNALNNK